MKHSTFLKRSLAGLLSLALVAGTVPAVTPARAAAAPDYKEIVSDPSTAMSYESMLGTDVDGNRYSGRIWADKSVYDRETASGSVTLDGNTVSFDDNFMVVYSALGSTTTVTTSVALTSSLDVVIILDNSSSMGRYVNNDDDAKVTRLEAVTEAANHLIADIMTGENNRVSVVTFSTGATTLLPLDHYTRSGTAEYLTLSDYNKPNIENSSGGVRVDSGDARMTATAVNSAGTTVTNTNTGYQQGTNLQSGLYTGMNILANADDTDGRSPVVIFLSDGVADMAVSSYWYNVGTGSTVHPSSNTLTAGVAAGTVMTAAYMRAAIEDNYAQTPMVYSVGMDLGSDSTTAGIVLDPSQTNFSDSASLSLGQTAYGYYESWYNSSSNYTVTANNVRWTFNALPATSAVTKNDVAENIWFVDEYMPVTSADIDTTFENIYDEISTPAFHPITDSVVQMGGTQRDTPLTYVDFIGYYMEVKEIKQVTLYGETHSVTADPDNTSATAVLNLATGLYDVTVVTPYLVGDTADTITHPVMGTSAALRDSVRIEVKNTYSVSASSVSEALAASQTAPGKQEVWIYVYEEAMPLFSDAVVVKNGEITYTANYTSEEVEPLRVYYTVDISSYLLDGEGNVDYSLIDWRYVEEYGYTLYTNRFGEMNSAENGTLYMGDAHVSATPSLENRYYYHQINSSIFSDVVRTDGAAINWNPEEYGVLYYENGVVQNDSGEDEYAVTDMTYADMAGLTDSTQVYTNIWFYAPDEATADPDDGKYVSYIVYTTWGQLSSCVAFYDAVNGVYINGYDGTDYITSDAEGYVLSDTAVVDSYIAANGLSADDIRLHTGIGSWRISRLDNMHQAKSENTTDTAVYAYDPAFNTDPTHVGSIVTWLGNNGRLTLDEPTSDEPTGLSITKNVTETAAGGEAEFSFTVTVTAEETFTAAFSGAGADTLSTWTQNGTVLTGKLKDGETVTVTGLPAGAAYTVAEGASSFYTAAYTGASGTLTAHTVTPVTVTNTPKQPGTLYITKTVVSDYEIPQSIRNETFAAVADMGTENAGVDFDLISSEEGAFTQTADADGKLHLTLSHGETVQILDIPFYQQVTVTEQLTPQQQSCFTGTVRSRDYSGAAAEDDGTVTVHPDTNATVVITNTYVPESVTVDLDISASKNFVVDSPMGEDASFTFEVQEYDPDTKLWNTVGTKTVTLEYAAGTSGVKNFSFSDIGGTYTAPGTYSYRVLEVIPEEAEKLDGVSYDRTIYTYTVTVTDAGGQLTAAVTDRTGAALTPDTGGSYSAQASFVNTYHTAPLAVDIVKEVEDQSGNPAITAAGWTFVAVETDQNRNPIPNGTTVRETTDASGKIRFTSVIDTEGTRYFLVSEEGTAPAGWTYDETKYFVQVDVTADSTGNLTAALTVTAIEADGSETTTSCGSYAELEFTNTYAPTPAELDLSAVVKKSLEGRALVPGEFRFCVYNNNDRTAPVLTGTNDSSGNVIFEDALTFTKVGIYHYDVVEETGVLGGVDYDETVYDLVVTVSDNGDGTLKAEYFFEDSTSPTVTFRNTYTVTGSAEVKLSGVKRLDVISGTMVLKNDQFLFVLFDETGAEVGRATNLGGVFTLPALRYTAADLGKTFVYTVREINTQLPGVTYDTEVYTLTVTVGDNGAGELTAAAALTDSSGAPVELKDTDADGIFDSGLVFENRYEADLTDAVISGTKTLIGRDLEPGEFTFQLFATDASYSITGAPIETVNNADGTFSFTVSDLDVGTYYYMVCEKAGTLGGVTYDTARYPVNVVVQDIGGRLMATVNLPGGNISFRNTYTPTPATVAITAVKEVTGAALGTYEFGIYAAEYDSTTQRYEPTGQPIATAVNDANGNVRFRDGVFRNPGEYYYIVAEIIPDGAEQLDDGTYSKDGIRYDDTRVLVCISVEDDGEGALTAGITYDGLPSQTGPTFTNRYIPYPIEVELGGTKILEGRELINNQFVFQLFEAEDDTFRVPDGARAVTAANNADGTFAFAPVLFDGADTRYYVIREQIPNDTQGILYDTSEYHVTVTVTDDGNGVLAPVISVTLDGQNVTEISFVNTHSDEFVEKDVSVPSAPSVSIDGANVSSGDELIYTIRYTNPYDTAADVTVTDTVPQHTVLVEGSVSQNGVYSAGTVTWVFENVAPGQTVTATFRVKVDGVNTTVSNEAGVEDGINRYTTNAVTVVIPPNGPQTGDSTNYPLYLTLTVLSLLGMALVPVFGKRWKKA